MVTVEQIEDEIIRSFITFMRMEEKDICEPSKELIGEFKDWRILKNLTNPEKEKYCSFQILGNDELYCYELTNNGDYIIQNWQKKYLTKYEIKEIKDEPNFNNLRNKTLKNDYIKFSLHNIDLKILSKIEDYFLKFKLFKSNLTIGLYRDSSFKSKCSSGNITLYDPVYYENHKPKTESDDTIYIRAEYLNKALEKLEWNSNLYDFKYHRYGSPLVISEFDTEIYIAPMVPNI